MVDYSILKYVLLGIASILMMIIVWVYIREGVKDGTILVKEIKDAYANRTEAK